MLIIPPQIALYMSLAPEAKLTYPLGGPAAAAAFEAGMQGFEARAFRGLGVMTSTPVRRCRRRTHAAHMPPHTRQYSHDVVRAQYEVSDDQDSVQMLQRSSQVGEFYRMSPPAVFNQSKRLPPSYMGEHRHHTTTTRARGGAHYLVVGTRLCTVYPSHHLTSPSSPSSPPPPPLQTL